MMSAPNATPSLQREVTMTRVFDAPRSLVFQMWTDPGHVAQWWGPAGFTNPVCEIDARPGGTMRILMRAPNGDDHLMTGRFHEVVAPERLVFITTPVDAAGKPLLEGLTTVAFAEHGGKTTVTVHTQAVGFVAQAARMLDGMEPGWRQSLDRLDALLARLRAGA
jgi:uncharacterized protein YndB with AHSA1/START domain